MVKYAKLGRSDLNVSRICMGCMGFGYAATGQHSWTVSETQTREIIKHGLDLGINFFDTAIAYQNGTSEQYVGKALRDFAKRDDFVIATKFTPRTQEEIDADISGQKHIENYLNQSLRNLRLDYFDLYIYHMWWYVAPTIINTFLESYNFSGKKIVLFATSGGSGFGKAVAGLKPSVSESTEIVEGRILNSADALKKWVKEL